jgi:hypothetical protein
MGWNIQMVRIPQFNIRVSYPVCNPSFVKREGQFSIGELVHEFENPIFD